ncbi:hypothetical protein KCU66_g27, partial [Aureobasidium melanogenum]
MSFGGAIRQSLASSRVEPFHSSRSIACCAVLMNTKIPIMTDWNITSRLLFPYKQPSMNMLFPTQLRYRQRKKQRMLRLENEIRQAEKEVQRLQQIF